MTDILSSGRRWAENGKGNRKSHLCLFVRMDIKWGDVDGAHGGSLNLYFKLCSVCEMI